VQKEVLLLLHYQDLFVCSLRYKCSFSPPFLLLCGGPNALPNDRRKITFSAALQFHFRHYGLPLGWRWKATNQSA